MTSYTLQVQPRASYTIEYSNQRGPQGPAGADGDDASATTDASLLVSGTLSDARLSSNVLLASSIGTNVQAWDADLDAIAALATTATGRALLTESVAQTGTGALVRATSPTLTTPNIGDATATVLRRGSTSFDIIILFDATVFSCSLSGFTSQKHCSFGWQAGAGSAQGVAISASGNLAFSNSANDSTATRDTNLSRNAAGVVQIGTTANNALGSLLLTNLTASGTVTATGLLDIRKSGSANLIRYATNGYFSTDTSQLFLFNAGTGTNDISFHRGGNTFNLSSSFQLGFNSTTNAGGGVVQTTVSQQSAGVVQIGSGASSNALGSLLLTNLTASGTLRVGGGTVVANILSATATLDFGSIGSNDTETLTITVTGAVAGDSVFLGVPAGLDAGLIFCASVTAANTVTVRMHNSSGGSIDPASGTFRATVIRF